MKIIRIKHNQFRLLNNKMKIKIPLRLRKLRIFINKKICKIQKNKIWIKNNSISRKKKKGKEVFLKKLKKMEIK